MVYEGADDGIMYADKWVGCCDFDDDIGAIGTGRTGGSTMEEVDAFNRSSGSSSGAGGNDLRFDLAMVG